jgi:hypothetical protein
MNNHINTITEKKEEGKFKKFCNDLDSVCDMYSDFWFSFLSLIWIIGGIIKSDHLQFIIGLFEFCICFPIELLCYIKFKRNPFEILLDKIFERFGI